MPWYPVHESALGKCRYRRSIYHWIHVLVQHGVDEVTFIPFEQGLMPTAHVRSVAEFFNPTTICDSSANWVLGALHKHRVYGQMAKSAATQRVFIVGVKI